MTIKPHSFLLSIAFLFTLLIPLIGISQAPNAEDANKGLKDYYKSYFPMGVAIRPQSVSGPEAELVLKHYVSVTAENAIGYYS